MLSSPCVNKRVTFHSLGLDKKSGERMTPSKSMDIQPFESYEVEEKEDDFQFVDGLPELGSGTNTVLRFSNNYYTSPPTEKRYKAKSGKRSGRQTPLPSSGLQPLIGTTETALEMEEVGGGSEMEQGTLENGSQTCSSDIINVPPLVPSNADGFGEKRKPTPPDLLSLAQMYFDRNHRTLVNHSSDGPAPASSHGLRKFHSVDSRLTLPSERPTLEFSKPRKLTPLITKPSMTKESITSLSSGRQALHLSVKYTPNSNSINAKTSLAPLISNHSNVPQHQKLLSGRKKTFVIESVKSQQTS